MCERDFDWCSSELICSIVFFVPDKRKSAGLTKARADMDAVAVFFFSAHLFHAWFRAPQNTLISGWQTVFILASLQICSIQLWGIGGKTAGPGEVQRAVAKQVADGWEIAGNVGA